MADELKKELRGRTLGYVSAALGLVAGLAWNDAIRAAIETIFPLSKDTIMVKFLYANGKVPVRYPRHSSGGLAYTIYRQVFKYS